MEEYRIVVVPLVVGVPPNSVFDYQALRVSPNVYTTLEEIDTFIMAMEEALKGNMPDTLGLVPAYPAEAQGIFKIPNKFEAGGRKPPAGTYWVGTKDDG
jgi:hypothetical protein